MLDFFGMIGDFIVSIGTFIGNFFEGLIRFVDVVTMSSNVVPTFAHLMPGIISSSVLSVGFIGAIKGIFGR